MKKYLVSLVVLILLSALVSLKHERYANNPGKDNLTITENNTPNSKGNPPESENKAERWWERGYLFFGWPNGITIWALILTMIVIAEQTRETRNSAQASAKQAVLTEDTAKRQLRAYLCVSSGQVTFDSNSFRTQVFIKNSGQTPAYDVRSWGTIVCREHPLTTALQAPPPGMPQGSGIILPDGEHQTAIGPKPKTMLDMGIFYEQTKALYVYGEVSYRDIFGDYHTLDYRLIFGGQAGAAKKMTEAKDGIQTGMLSMDVEGNKERDHGKERPS